MSLSQQACPECRTLAPPGPACPHCQVNLRWLADAPAFQQALTLSEHPGWIVQLRVVIRSHQETRNWCEQLTVAEGGAPRLSGPSDSIEQIAPGLDELVVRLGEDAVRLSLPGELESAHRLVAARLEWVVAGGAPSPLEASGREDWGLNRGQTVSIGRARDCTFVLPHEEVSLRHAIIARDPQTTAYWLADAGSATGVFVNRRRVASCQLSSGDLVQIGPFGWIFSEADGFLSPVAPIAGARVRLTGELTIPQRVTVAPLTLEPGQLVAMIGSSGGGKSTFLKALAGLEPAVRPGQVVYEAGGNQIDPIADMEGRGEILGYVSQQPFVHPERTPWRILWDADRFRRAQRSGGSRAAGDRQRRIQSILHRADLAERLWRRPLSRLSGGEQQRVRTAAELVHEPGLLLLDEPGAGLDAHREQQLMRQLRSLADRGATVIVILHNRALTAHCDRVLEFSDGRLLHDSAPGALSADFAPPDTDHPAAASRPDVRPVSRQTSAGRKVRRQLAQFGILAQREWELAAAIGRLAILTLIAVLFAVAVHLGVKRSETDLIGFFSVLSALWLGASLSHLSIVRERAVYEHERHAFLKIPAYLLAKFLVLAVLIVFQTTLFGFVMWLLGSKLLNGDGGGGVILALWPIGLAGAALGLVISAVGRSSLQRAAALLPLAMIVQIVFSVPVSLGKQVTLAVAQGPWKDNRGADWVSRFTLSRPGDLLLHTFAYGEPVDVPTMLQGKYVLGLALWTVGLLFLTGMILWGQSARLGAVMLSFAPWTTRTQAVEAASEMPAGSIRHKPPMAEP